MPTRNVDIGTGPVAILAYNNRRTAASFTNNGAATIFVSNDQTSITAEGLPLVVGGGLDLIRALGDEPHIQWFASVAAGSEELRVLEAFGQLPVLETPPARESRADAEAV